MSAQPNEKIKVVELDDLEQARKRSESASGATGGINIPVSIFWQGKRTMLAGALPVDIVVQNLVSDAATHKAGLAEVQGKRNRPLYEDHVAEIERYLTSNLEEAFILPPLTLNVMEDSMTVYTFKEEEGVKRPTRAGFLVIPRHSQIDIADGQHRREGIKRAYDEVKKDRNRLQLLASSSLAVMLTCETDRIQIHQDFADCSRTKPIAPSQLAVYDRRNPANALVLGLAEQCDLFRDRLDTTSLKLGKASPYPFITNQVRQVVKVMLHGTNAEADDVFEAKARKFLGEGTSPKVQALIHRYAAYINRATQAIPEYNEIASTPPGSQLRQKLIEWRNTGYISLTGTGLVAVARVLYELAKDREPDWQPIVDRMAHIDWRRVNPKWSSRVVTPDRAKVNTGYAASMEAARDIKRMIGWAPSVEAMAGPAAKAEEDLFADAGEAA